MENKSFERSNIVLVICGFIGVGFTLPMAFFISADAYWKHKWRILENSSQPFNLGIVINYMMILKWSKDMLFAIKFVRYVLGPLQCPGLYVRQLPHSPRQHCPRTRISDEAEDSILPHLQHGHLLRLNHLHPSRHGLLAARVLFPISRVLHPPQYKRLDLCR